MSYPVKLLLAVVCGALYSAAFPPLGWRWLLVPGLAGLLAALQGERGTRARALGFLHGMAAYGIGLSWLWQIFGWLVIVLWMVLAAFHALFAEMQSRAVARGFAGWKLAVFTALNWGAWEFIRAELFPLKFPWMTAGLAMGPNALLPWIGVYGAGVVAVLGVALLVQARWRAAALVAGVAALSIWFLPKHRQPGGEETGVLKVGGVQLENVTLEGLIKETRNLPEDVRHVAWPEYAVPYDIRRNARDWNLVKDLCRERNIVLTIGTQRLEDDGKSWRNIALTFDSEKTYGEHTKVHTVHFFDDGKPGETALPVVTRHGRMGTPVCFDCDYESVTRRMTAAGAEMFIVPIMDAEKWTARQHDQHAELYRIRACENGRWMFICASSGVSQVIDPHGHVHTKLAALKQGTLVGTINRETKLTFYTRHGWMAPWCVLGLAAACWMILLLRSGEHRPAPKHK